MSSEIGIGMFIKSVSNQIIRFLNRESLSQEFPDHTAMQMVFLNYIGDNAQRRDIFQKELEREFSIRSSSATGMLRNMQLEGLIDRIPSAEDGRYKKIILTKKGEAIFKEKHQELQNIEKRLLSGVDPDELMICKKVLKQIEENANT